MMEPAYVDAIWLTVAFFCGIAARKINLPPLIGFLVTGFILNASGLTTGHMSEILHVLSDLGVMLLLFTIGLKINVRTLIRREIWVTASVHMIISVLAISASVFLIGYAGLRLFSDLSLAASLLIGFALSFSSTVFVVKILEERGELNSYHGRLSIGILVIQDLIAVLFISLSKSEWPGIWVLSIPVYLYLVRFILNRILDEIGHGELLTIFGMFTTFIAGALSFKLVGLKPDLGALVIGMVMAGHPRSKELYERMMSYKDFFLTAFFINIGLSGIPGAWHIIAALILIIFVNMKGALFLLILSRFKIRARTAFLSSVALGNFSEFALITGVVGMEMGWISEDWILVMALAMSFSFLAASPLNNRVHDLFDFFKPWIGRLNRNTECIDEEPYSLGNIKYLVVGMGELGHAAYSYLEEEHRGRVLGIDYDHELIARLKDEGINAEWGDATDINLWQNADMSNLETVLFAMEDHPSNINSIREILKIKDQDFRIGVISHFPDEREDFEKLNVDYIYDYRNNLGRDFAKGLIPPSS